MSLFGATTTSQTAATPFSFGAPAATPISATPAFTLPTFSSAPPPIATAPTFGAPATAGPTFGTSAISGPSFGTPATSAQLVQNVGLGGTSENVQNTTTTASVTKPKDALVPAELLELVNTLKQTIHENKQLCDEMTSRQNDTTQTVDTDLRQLTTQLTTATNDIQGLSKELQSLKQSSRGSLLHAETVMRRNDTLPNICSAEPVNYLKAVCNDHQHKVMSLRNNVLALEQTLQANAQGCSNLTPQHLAVVMQRMEEYLKTTGSRVDLNHDNIIMLRERFRLLHSQVMGATAKDPFAKSMTVNKMQYNRAPDPFSVQSRAAILAEMASAATATPAPQPAQQTGGLFSTNMPTVGPSLFSTPAPTGSLFSTPPQVNKPNNSGFFGSATARQSTPAFATSLNTTNLFNNNRQTQQFSSPFNSTSSGTLFGGSATLRPLAK